MEYIAFRSPWQVKRGLEGHAGLFLLQYWNDTSFLFTISVIPLLEVVKWHYLSTRGWEVNESTQIFGKLLMSLPYSTNNISFFHMLIKTKFEKFYMDIRYPLTIIFLSAYIVLLFFLRKQLNLWSFKVIYHDIKYIMFQETYWENCKNLGSQYLLDIFYLYNNFTCDSRRLIWNQLLKSSYWFPHHAKIFCKYVTISTSSVTGGFFWDINL